MLYQNIKKAEIRGTEGIFSLDLGGDTRATVSAEYIEARDGTSGERLTERPRWQGRLRLHTKAGRLALEGRLRHVHGFWAPDTTTVITPNYESNYTTLDVRADYPVGAATAVFAGINNLLNEALPENMAFRGTPDIHRFATTTPASRPASDGLREQLVGHSGTIRPICPNAAICRIGRDHLPR